MSALNDASKPISTADALAEARKVKTQYAALDARTKQKYRADLKAEREVLVKAAKAELAKAKKLSDANPTAQSVYKLGSLYQQLGDEKAAKASFTKAIKLDDKLADAHNDLGLSLLRDAKLSADKVDTALKQLTAAQKQDTELPKTNIAVAQEMRSLLKVPRTKLGPADYNLRGIEYLKLGEFDSAKKCFQNAIAEDSNNAESYNNLALCYIYGDLDIGKALDAALKALELNPNLPTQQLIMATTLAKSSLESKE
jgi:tetratricopeptide (TPR) repeat protein